MTYDAEIMIYGNLKLSEGTSHRPVVTFVLFAYNQEKYIRAAVEGAFAQTYSPLEIVLSDDFSSDKTFAIILEMANNYVGPHQVRVARNQQNLGVVKHVFARGQEALGKIVVVAAGDDISVPERCERHVALFQRDDVLAVTGGYDVIDAEGKILALNKREPADKFSLQNQKSLFKSDIQEYRVIQGSTASYQKTLFSTNLPKSNILFSEDNLINFIVYLQGHRVGFLEESLVKYRVHDQAISNRPPMENNFSAFETHRQMAAARQANKMAIFIWLAQTTNNKEAINIELMNSIRLDNEIIFKWPTLSLWQRIKEVFWSIVKLERYMVIWKLMRLFGHVSDYQPALAFWTMTREIRKAGRRRR